MELSAKLAIAFLWGGLLAIERRAFLQAMVSRPLVAATGMGLLLGDLESGLYTGMLLELYHLGAANLGAALGENDTLAATGAAAAAASLADLHEGYSTPTIWALAILLCIPLGRFGRVVDRSLERHSTHLAGLALKIAETGNLKRAVRQNLWGMWPHFLCYGAATMVCAAGGHLLQPVVHALPLPVARGLAWSYPAMASVAAAIAARGSHAKRAPLWALGTGAVVVVVFLAFGNRGGA